MKNKIIPLIVYPVNAGYVNNLKPTIHGTGEPGATINGALDGTGFSVKIQDNGVWSYPVGTPFADGTNHTVNVTQTGTDNEVSAETSVEFKADTNLLVDPAVAFPTNNQFINSKTPVLSGTGKAGASIEARILNATYTTAVNHDGQWQIKVTEPLPEGTVFLNIVQKDMGNISPVLNLTFNVDTFSPKEPELKKPMELGYENTKNPIVCGKGEPNATVDAIVDDKKYTAPVNQNGDWSFEVSESLTDDTHIISAKQKDPAGNISPEKVSVFEVNTRQPAAPQVISPENGEFCPDNRPVLKGRGEKDNRVEVHYLDKVYYGLVDSDGTWKVKIADSLPDGTGTFKIYQVNKAGNVSPYSVLTLKIDTAIPLAPVVLYPENESYVNSTKFTIRGTGEPDAEIKCTLAGKDYSAKVLGDGSWSVEIDGNENLKDTQNYSIAIKQIDMAGNESPSLRVKFKISMDSLKAPEIISPENNSILNSVNPVITGKGKAGAVINLNRENDVFSTVADENGNWTVTFGKSLPQGANAVNVTQIDHGNVSPASVVSFVVDTISPVAPQVTYPTENQSIHNGSLVIRGYGEAGASIQIKLDDQQLNTTVKSDNSWDCSVPNVLENGMHVILASQVDKAGNQSQDYQVYFVINTGNPVAAPDGKPVDCKVLYNPSGPDWAAKVIAVLKTNQPVTVGNVCGTIFSRVITANGISLFDYMDLNGNNGKVTAGVTWIDSKPTVIQVESCGNYFSSDKTVTYFKPVGSAVKCALLNGEPFESGRVVKEEGIYDVNISDQAGNTATENFIIDKTPPDVLGVEDRKVYHTDVRISYFDNTSGVKSALLNNKSIPSETVITEDGEYKLIITDFGDNTREINFKIQKQ